MNLHVHTCRTPPESHKFRGPGYCPFGRPVTPVSKGPAPSELQHKTGRGTSAKPSPIFNLRSIFTTLKQAASSASSFEVYNDSGQSTLMNPFSIVNGTVESLCLHMSSHGSMGAEVDDHTPRRVSAPVGVDMSSFWNNLDVPYATASSKGIFTQPSKLLKDTVDNLSHRRRLLYLIKHGNKFAAQRPPAGADAIPQRQATGDHSASSSNGTPNPKRGKHRRYVAHPDQDHVAVASEDARISILRVFQPGQQVQFAVLSASARHPDAQVVIVKKRLEDLLYSCSCKQPIPCSHMPTTLCTRAAEFLRGLDISTTPADLRPDAVCQLDYEAVLWSVVDPDSDPQLATVAKGRCMSCNSSRCGHVCMVQKCVGDADDDGDLQPDVAVRPVDDWLQLEEDQSYKTNAWSTQVKDSACIVSVLLSKGMDRPAGEYVQPTAVQTWAAANALGQPPTLLSYSGAPPNPCPKACDDSTPQELEFDCLVIAQGYQLVHVCMKRLVRLEYGTHFAGLMVL